MTTRYKRTPPKAGFLVRHVAWFPLREELLHSLPFPLRISAAQVPAYQLVD